MLRPRHRVKSNLLWKMLGLAILLNILLWPILIRLGKFAGIRRELLIPVTLISLSPSHKGPDILIKVPKTTLVVAKSPAVAVVPPPRKPRKVLTATVPPARHHPLASHPVAVDAAKPRVDKPVAMAQAPVSRKPKPAHHPAEAESIGKAPSSRFPHQLAAPRIAIRPTAKPVTKTAVRVVRQVPIVRQPTPVVNPKPLPSENPERTAVVPPFSDTHEAPPPSETFSSRLRPAVAVERVQPEIPRSMQNHAWHALFRGQFTVAKDGAVTPRMVSSTGNPDLDARALAAAKHWKFRPATQDGVPIPSNVKFEIEYTVRSAP